MNFLALCQQACRDGGWRAIIPQLTTVVGASGKPGAIVGWVRDAWVDIQNERQDWLFLRHTFAKALTINQSLYTKTDLTLPRLARFIVDTGCHRTMTLYETAKGQADEGEITYIPYNSWLEMYDRGVVAANRPRDWSMSPQRELLIGPKPDKAYTLKGEYRAQAQVLALDADIPECPDEFHHVISCEAVRLGHQAGEALQLNAVDSNLYSRLRSGLVIDQTPNLTTM